MSKWWSDKMNKNALLLQNAKGAEEYHEAMMLCCEGLMENYIPLHETTDTPSEIPVEMFENPWNNIKETSSVIEEIDQLTNVIDSLIDSESKYIPEIIL